MAVSLTYSLEGLELSCLVLVCQLEDLREGGGGRAVVEKFIMNKNFYSVVHIGTIQLILMWLPLIKYTKHP